MKERYRSVSERLVCEQNRLRNRLHAYLLVLAPGHRDSTGALSNRAGLQTARSLFLTARANDSVRAKLGLAANRRLRALDKEIAAIESDIETELAGQPTGHLRAICGVGPITAAKILGEVRDLDRFPTEGAFASCCESATAPDSSGTTTRHRLQPRREPQLKRALFTIARSKQDGSPRSGLPRAQTS